MSRMGKAIACPSKDIIENDWQNTANLPRKPRMIIKFGRDSDYYGRHFGNYMWQNNNNA